MYKNELIKNRTDPTVAGVKAPSGSPATSQAAGSTTGAPLHLHKTSTAATDNNIDLTAMALAQKSCSSIPQLQTSSSLHLQFFPAGQQSLCCDVSGGRRRPMVPLSWRRWSEGGEGPRRCYLLPGRWPATRRAPLRQPPWLAQKQGPPVGALIVSRPQY